MIQSDIFLTRKKSEEILSFFLYADQLCTSCKDDFIFFGLLREMDTRMKIREVGKLFWRKTKLNWEVTNSLRVVVNPSFEYFCKNFVNKYSFLMN